MRPVVLFTLGLLLVLVAVRCESDHGARSGPTPGTGFLAVTERGCVPEFDGGPLQPHTAYLVDHAFDGDTLVLTIHFTANCCPDFQVMPELGPQTIDLQVDDPLHECDCYCTYQEDFSLLWSAPGELYLSFRCTEGPAVVCSFDTLFTVGL